jgi:hypothetical protein
MNAPPLLGKKAWLIILSLKARDSQCDSVNPASEKFSTAPSVGKVMLTAFWDVNDAVHLEFMLTGATINSEHYAGTLQKLRACSLFKDFIVMCNRFPSNMTLRGLGFTVLTTHYTSQTWLHLTSTSSQN